MFNILNQQMVIGTEVAVRLRKGSGNGFGVIDGQLTGFDEHGVVIGMDTKSPTCIPWTSILYIEWKQEKY